MFLVNIFSFIIKKLLRFGRFLMVSGVTFAFILYTIGSYTKSDYGIANLYLIAGALVFFPMFAGLFNEFFWSEVRKEKRKTQKSNTSYLKEDIKETPLMR